MRALTACLVARDEHMYLHVIAEKGGLSCASL
jgi:hypothetical protein